MAHLPDAVPLNQVHRALVVNLRHHGDVLLCSPLIGALKRHAPHCEIDALVYADTAPMLELHPALAQLHRIERSWKDLGLLARARAEWRLLSDLRRRKYDLLIVLTPHRRGQRLARLLRPRWSVAPHYADGGRRWTRSFTHIVQRPIATWRHTVEVYLDSLRRIGCHPARDERALCLVPGESSIARVDALLHANGLANEEFIHVHPAARWQFKCWPAPHFADLIRQLHRSGWKVVLSSAPEDGERAVIREILQAVGAAPVVDLSGQLSLKELAALTARARLFIGVDSAPMHIAAAMGTPQIALFGPSGARQWGPWSARARVLTHPDFQCIPCGRDGCGGGKLSECLTSLPVSQVLEAATEMLAGNPGTQPPVWMAHAPGVAEPA